MDSTTELNEIIESSTEHAPHHLKMKENESTAQAPDLVRRSDDDEQAPEDPDCNALEHAARIISPRSPEIFMETLAGKALSFDPVSVSEPGSKVEELTLGNYKGPNALRGEGSTVKKGLWSNLTRLAGDPRPPMGNVGDGRSLMMPQLPARGIMHSGPLEPNYSKVNDYLVESENRILSRNAPASDGIRTKMLPSSGFPQFVVRNDLRGKGVAFRHPVNNEETRVVIQNQNSAIKEESNVDVDSNMPGRLNERVDDEALIGGGKNRNEGFSMREWLTPSGHKLNKAERLHRFKQVLELVDSSHSQGLVLRSLRPSYFLVLPSNQVKYIGSLVPQSRMEQLVGASSQAINYLGIPSKRKGYFERGTEGYGILFPKHQKHGGSYDSTAMLGYPAISSSGRQKSMSELQKLEEIWYVSPEELQDNLCLLSSNIYSLGVLLFELFCCFETWEQHLSAMSDLRYRILPPSFLSESPKEAGFCLWLLHPEPACRPNSRDILQCDLICEGRDLSSLDESSALIDEEDAEADLLLHFLLNLKEQKEKQASKLVADVGCLKSDIQEVERRYSSDTCCLQTNLKDISVSFDDYSLKRSVNMEGTSKFSDSNVNEERLLSNINKLENAYFSLRPKVEPPEMTTVARSDIDVLKIRDKQSHFQNDDNTWKESTDPLGNFFEGLCKYARYSKFEVCGNLRSVDIPNSANVICSLSFDRDEDYFATAGVSKKIKIFEFDALLKDTVDIHFPLIEMSSKSRLSCVCWNSYIKNYLASTDYEGIVQIPNANVIYEDSEILVGEYMITSSEYINLVCFGDESKADILNLLWDASTGQGFTHYAEHRKRAWSVDFSVVDPTKLASGSDDCSVKLWSIKERNCIDTIRNAANVCCVQFSSHSSHMLAFGSADYKIYCFDLRNTRNPWCTLAGHGKAVSYVKFLDSNTVVSASTDNTLKLWDLKKTSPNGLSSNACSLTLRGHTNEKNFVGLSVSDGYITCGSETNEVYAYYNTLPMPITCHKFGSVDPIMGHEAGDDNGQFVSSVCWRNKSNMVVAANSTGSIEVLRMV